MKKFIAVITGDVIGSRKAVSPEWLLALKAKLGQFGSAPKEWEIYRVAEYQLEVAHPAQALIIALQHMSCIKKFNNMLVRLASDTVVYDYDTVYNSVHILCS